MDRRSVEFARVQGRLESAAIWTQELELSTKALAMPCISTGYRDDTVTAGQGRPRQVTILLQELICP